MHDERDVAIIVLTLVIATCLTLFFLKVADPTGALVELLFPESDRMKACRSRWVALALLTSPCAHFHRLAP